MSERVHSGALEKQKDLHDVRLLGSSTVTVTCTAGVEEKSSLQNLAPSDP
jgi:hypothetical protein